MEFSEFNIFWLFWLFCAVVAAYLASKRDRNGFKWLLVGLVIGPLAFIFAVRPPAPPEGDKKRTTDAQG